VSVQFKVVVYCHANSEIGMGHAVRTGALLHELPEDVEIICCVDEILVKSYFPRSSVIQPSTLDAVKEAISNSNIPTVVIFDLPENSSDFLDLSRHDALCVTISDYSSNDIIADIVIDPSDLLSEHIFSNLPSHSVVLRGLSYALLRQPFSIGNHGFRRGTSIGFVVGSGALSFSWARNIVTKFDASGLGTVEIVVSRAQPEINKLKAIGADRGISVCTGLDAEEMVQYYTKLGLCVMTGGTAIYEAMATGTPLLVYPILKTMLRESSILSSMECVEVLSPSMTTPLPLRVVVNELLSNTSHLTHIAKKSKRLVDGQGCKRVVQFIERVMHRQHEGQSKFEAIRMEALQN